MIYSGIVMIPRSEDIPVDLTGSGPLIPRVSIMFGREYGMSLVWVLPAHDPVHLV
jgi:hypothetical protein